MKKFNEIFKTTKSKVGFVILIIAIIGGIIVTSQMPPSVESVYGKIKDMDSEDQFAYLSKHLDDKGMFGKQETKVAAEALQMLIDNINNSMIAQTGGTVDDYTSVKITKVDIENTYSYSSDYVDINTTVQNNSSKTICYIKLNLFFKDKSGNIISSDWTNDSSDIKPGASQVVDKMMKSDGWDSVSVEIDDITFK